MIGLECPSHRREARPVAETAYLHNIATSFVGRIKESHFDMNSFSHNSADP